MYNYHKNQQKVLNNITRNEGKKEDRLQRAGGTRRTFIDENWGKNEKKSENIRKKTFFY